ncbi:hypothetical protein MMC09_002291 [Bachmanniomyces sp. S44760]|nr:hypothetical protein [Bachmanniomyces sp. S44760]
MNQILLTLQPLTQNLPAPLPSLLTQLLGPKCYKHLIHDLTLPPQTFTSTLTSTLTSHNTPSPTIPCLKLALSKTLGLGIITASSIVKIPQIIKLIQSQSAAGISFLAYLAETLAYLIGLAYNIRRGFPFSTFGETAFILGQNLVVLGLVLGFGGGEQDKRGDKGKGGKGDKGKGRWGGVAALVVGLVTLGYALFDQRVVGMELLKVLQVGAGVLGVASKAPQIWTVWREGGTGQLSAFAVFNYLAGSLTRIFTTLQEVDDKLILYGFITGFVLNAILAAQMVYYWNSPKTARHAKELGKAPEKIAMGSTTATSSKAKNTTTRRRG